MNPSSLVGHVLELLRLMEANAHPADKIASVFFRERTYIGSHDRRFIAEAVFGIIRHRRYLEALVEHYLREHPDHAEIGEAQNRALVLYTCYAECFEPARQSLSPSESLWKTHVPKIGLPTFAGWMSKNKSLDFLAPWDHLVQLGVKYSFQDWMVEQLSRQAGNEIEPLLQSLNTPANITLRINLLKCSREECRERLQNENIETTPTRMSPAGLVARTKFNIHASQTFRDGWFELQDEGSQLVSLVANPKPGNIVFDVCAGAGGKALHLAGLMGDQGEIVAIDVSPKRLSELQSRARRVGVTCIRSLIRDDLRPEEFSGKADLVLVDAPCSGVGTIRRNPWMKWNVTEALVEHYAEKQRSILDFSAQFVKPGGRLVYATCSLLRKENEEVVGAFLSTHAKFTCAPLNGSGDLYGLSIDGGIIRLLPHRDGTDGFFIALLRKTGN